MVEFFVSLVLGIFCIVMGVLNTRGNLSSLHVYHRKRVTEENRLPFGRLVGIGTIIIGVGLIVSGFLALLSNVFEIPILLFVGMGFLIGGFVVGIVLNFYAMIKYNKGIF